MRALETLHSDVEVAEESVLDDVEVASDPEVVVEHATLEPAEEVES